MLFELGPQRGPCVAVSLANTTEGEKGACRRVLAVDLPEGSPFPPPPPALSTPPAFPLFRQMRFCFSAPFLVTYVHG